ncbi:MAG TPA: molybdate ABC transporter substrate-binding protein [Steroidobacteraceae bacterium]|jgi:molybdate transport system substrate-binding protein|nr:molybdate ABC transporter substrate-binding protein [Steroidobacteraceae bacterium]
MKTSRRTLAGIGALLCLSLLALPAAAADTGKAPITVFAAASLTNALQDLGDAFTKETSIPVRFSFAASSALARQIENGAPADIFFSADLEWMDYLQSRNLIQRDTRHDVLGNRLVLIAPSDSLVKLKIEPNFALAAALGKGRLATGDPDSVPAGRYAREALTTLGVWSSVEGHLVRADSVRSALAFVDRGEAQLGIVYETDALIDKRVRVVDVFPASSHLPIKYPVALTTAAKGGAAKFLAYIRGPAGELAFKANGFTPLH